MINRKYFESNEDADFDLMTSINQLFKIEQLGRTPDKYFYDCSGYTSVGNYLEIELKNRVNYNLSDFQKFGSVMLECHKAAQMLLDCQINKATPIYVNFTKDGYAIVFNLHQLKETPKFYNFENIESKGYQRRENGARLLLPMTEAKIYHKNGNGDWQRVN